MPHRSSDRRLAREGLGHAGASARPAGATRRAGIIAGDYTLNHGGRQVRLGPVAFWTVVGTLVVMAVWSVATATYFAFRDDLLTRLIARQADMQYAYEDRIADLRAQVDRVTSRQLLDQEQFEQKLDQLMRRQATLESRATTLSGAVILVPPPDREARLESRALPTFAARVAATRSGAGIEATLALMQDSLDRVESGQAIALNGLEEGFWEDIILRRFGFSRIGISLSTSMRTRAIPR